MIPFYGIIYPMNNKHRKTLDKLMSRPALANIKFDDIDKLFIALGIERIEKEGSRVGYFINGMEEVVHKPHPSNEVPRYVVRNLQQFLKKSGVIK
jgi:hypothetical protein